MHKNSIFSILLVCSHFYSFADQVLLPGGIMHDVDFTECSDKKKSLKKTDDTQSLGQLVAQSVAAAQLPVITEIKDIVKDSYRQVCATNKFNRVNYASMQLALKSKIPVKAEFYRLKALANEEQADLAFSNLKNNFSRRVYAIPRIGFKSAAGALISQKLSNNVYKQIVYKHIVHALVDVSACPDNQAFRNYVYNTLPEQAVRGATVEATSWALTEYIFKKMEETKYDPFKLPPYQLGKSELLYVINPLLKDCSKLAVNMLLASYVVGPGYDKALSAATGRVANQAIAGLSFSFGDI